MAGPIYLRPSRAARYFPHEGRPPHPSKITRLITRGTPSCQRPGERIKLRAIRDSQGWLTTEEWIDHYIAELTIDRLGAVPPMPGVEERAEQSIANLTGEGW